MAFFKRQERPGAYADPRDYKPFLRRDSALTPRPTLGACPKHNDHLRDPDVAARAAEAVPGAQAATV